MKKIPLSLVLGLSLPLLPVLGAPASAQTVVNAPNAGIAADVNGDKILSADLNRMLATIKASDPSFATSSPDVTKALANIKGQVLDELITTKLLSQEAKRRKIVADPKQIDDAVTAIKTGNGFKTDAEFKTVLAKDGKTPDDLRRAIADELSIRELSKQLSADVTVSGDDIAAFYRANLAQFTVPEGVKARHILLAVNPDAPASAKEIQRKRALDLIKQLNNKADFAALAKANSDDQSNKNSGGDLGAFTRGQMVKPFEDAAFGAAVGKVVGPVETSFGLHIIRVDEKIPARVIPLSEVQADPRIKPFLLKEKVQKRLDESIAKLKTTAKIKKYV
ncbi:peptidyl-prolyl cis-trans isomerase C [Abditibacterium utsteinense]|uniref:Peptidyl-prolyl cis-trans isomerase C n=1 Tax=Abditibacterium utsteinense TaxID=1960156 RepID=A0A2S8SSV5_9BACT|nr:peptidylprolyl isomerase [Abditibacterium utsteinense]PQV63892.1 peptidyl-prolyl cis-trans isomerase C [Abditibacterium utsteinense]